MRAVLTGTDLLKDIDGTFKAIETNTNIQLSVDASIYFNETAFHNLMVSMSLNEVVYISKTELNEVLRDVDLDENNNIISGTTGKGLSPVLKEYCERNNFIFTPVIVDNNSITVPHIEDSPSKLIIRVSYDTTALIDDTYARDNWEFLKLMHDADSSSIPKTYINDTNLGFDTIGSVIRDNGNHPNFLIKKRITPADNRSFPKLIKIESLDKLEEIKNDLNVDEYLQEYIYNPNDLLDNRIKFYRSVDLIYGPNLDIFNLWCVEYTNIFQIDPSCDYDDSGFVQYWERPKYLHKVKNAGDTDPHLSGDQNTIVLLNDNTKISLSSIPIDSVIKTITIPDLPLDELTYNTSEWSSTYDNFIENYSVSTATLKSKAIQENWVGFLYEIETTDGIIFSDVSQAAILCKVLDSGTTSNYVVKFKTYATLEITDTILLFDTENNIMVDKQLISISLRYDKVNAYTTDFEQIDVFMTMEESQNSRWGILTHNYTYDCYTYYYYPACYSCYSGNYVSMSYGGCCRCESWYGACSGPWSVTCYDVDQQYTRTCDPGGYCNGNKSDKRLKKKIKHVETLENGIKIYQFEFKSHFIKKTKLLLNEDLSGIWQGVLAQDLIGTPNEIYVKVEDDGYYSVDYNGLGVRILKLK